jgi:diketogulonate reductase-like aldo/keto reductase
MAGETCSLSVKTALQLGYRLIDTASGYRNEKLVAEGLKQSKVPRKDVFIQTKISPKDQGYEKAKAAIDASIKELDTYVDLFLIHWPGTQKLALDDPEHEANRLGTWRALEEGVDAGKIKSIGVSNYQVIHLESLLREARIVPAVHQFECHPLYHPMDIIEYCEKRKIIIQAYSSLGEGKLVDGSISLPILEEISTRLHASPAQVLLQWGIHHGYSVLPKASSKERLAENLQSTKLVLCQNDVAALDHLTKSPIAQKFCWNSTNVA